MRYLNEVNWQPDLICGTSIGAINGAAFGSGMSVDELAHLWKTYHRKQMYKITFPAFFRTLLSGRKFSPLSDNRPTRSLLEKTIDIDALRNSTTEIIISVLNMRTSQVRYFTHKAIGIEHLMAAGGIPMMFPWQYIDGDPYWDAGVMVNTPIMPAFERGATEIIVVLLSPLGAIPQRLPSTHREVSELVFEQFLIGSYTACLPNAGWRTNPEADVYDTPLPDSPQLQLSMKGVRMATVYPTRMLGFRSLLDFSPRQAKTLLRDGYVNARMQLKSFFK
nr:phospholipase LIPESV1209A [uncultured bacterium]